MISSIIHAVIAGCLTYMWLDADDWTRSNFKRLYRGILQRTPKGEHTRFWDFEGVLLVWIIMAPFLVAGDLIQEKIRDC